MWFIFDFYVIKTTKHGEIQRNWKTKFIPIFKPHLRGGGGKTKFCPGPEKVSSRPCQYIRARLLQSLLQVGSLNWAIISYILTLPLVVQCIRAWLRRRKGVWVSDLEEWSLIKFPKASLMRRLFIFISPNSKLRPAHEIVSRDAIRRRLSLDLPASTQEIQEPEISCRSAAD